MLMITFLKSNCETRYMPFSVIAMKSRHNALTVFLSILSNGKLFSTLEVNCFDCAQKPHASCIRNAAVYRSS